ncbi:hypothetical protein AOC06_05300 [Polynucleobacter paludilacus]|uniref:hypothetical protein n=1 Tax=Polynucleobacter paludilacus TaxID=1855895 RepID=UPI001BFDCBDF|nr:hypothetical protein [Polynucleobacter paludilacus]QWD86392.1 hypothetical protein AOC06_05300 [Polynucleobacter paludilacus]
MPHRLANFIALSLLFLALAAQGESIRFVALGDMPYSLPKDFVRYERLIKAINADQPAFSIFVGDTKSGDTPCSDEYMEKTTRYFNSFNAPLIYSIGDNEWTDCHRTLAGSYDPIERLDRIRKTQFVDQNSFGKRRITLTRQSDVMPQFAKFVENSLWVKGKFVFVSLHIPGSNNNYERTPASTQEYLERNTANLAWIEYAFQLAQKKNAAGIVFAFQADMFYSPPGVVNNQNSGFVDTLNQFRSLAEKTALPILLIHGDSHRLRIDQPLLDSSRRVLENVYRLEVMGADEVQAVEVTVDDSKSSPFSFRPLLIPENLNPQ